MNMWTLRFSSYHNEKFSSCSLHKHILPEHGKKCPPCTNKVNVEKRNVTTQKILLIKSCSILDFYSDYYIPAMEKLAFNLPHVYILGKIIVQINGMEYSLVDTIITAENTHVIMQNYVRF